MQYLSVSMNPQWFLTELNIGKIHTLPTHFIVIYMFFLYKTMSELHQKTSPQKPHVIFH